jgi:hypothetical protein
VVKTLIKLAFAALLVNATWQLFTVYWAHFKFRDAVEATTQFRGEKTDSQVRERILELAGQFDVPVSDDNLSIQEDGKHTIVDTEYKRTVDLVPGFSYPWPFTLHVDTFTMKPATVEELAK